MYPYQSIAHATSLKTNERKAVSEQRAAQDPKEKNTSHPTDVYPS
jgi:hypothetical protein